MSCFPRENGSWMSCFPVTHSSRMTWLIGELCITRSLYSCPSPLRIRLAAQHAVSLCRNSSGS